MKLATFRYAKGAWSTPFPDLDSERTMVLAFAAPSYATRPDLVTELAAAYPRSALIGCSTAGEIDQAQIRDDSIAVAVVRFEQTRVRQAEARLTATSDERIAAQQIASELASPTLRAVLVLSPGTGVNGGALVSGLAARLPAAVTVTGGMAGDGDRFGTTWVVASGRIEPASVVAIGLYGDRVQVSHGSRGGWDPFGQAPDDHDSVVRTAVGVDEVGQSLTFAADVPVGSHEKPMRANLDRLVLGARAAATAAAPPVDGPALCVAISCVGRRRVLGERSEEETAAALEALPVGTAQVGFYAYGEIAPHVSGELGLHNQTMTLTVVSERA